MKRLEELTQSDRDFLKESIIASIRALAAQISRLTLNSWSCDYQGLTSMSYEALSELRDELVEDYNQILKGGE